MAAEELAVHSMSFSIPATDFNLKNACSIDFGGSVIKMTYAIDQGSHIKVNCLSFLQKDLQGALQHLRDHAQAGLKEVSTIDTCGIGCHQYEGDIKRVLGVGVRNLSEFQCFVDAFRVLASSIPLEELVFPKSETVQKYLDNYTECMKTAESHFKGDFKSNLEIWKFSSDDHHTGQSDSSSSSEEDDDDLQRVLRQQRRRMRKTRRRIRRERRRKERQLWLEQAKKNAGGTSVDPSDADCQANGSKTEEPNVVPYMNAPYAMPSPEITSDRPRLDISQPDTETFGKQSYVQYPVLLLMCGSGGGPMLIREDGVYNVLDINTICGRFFLAMGSLLTGAKNFKELIGLAERGDSEALNVVAKHMKTDGVLDFYSIFPGELVVYGMGHAVGKDIGDFRREDMAAAVLATVTLSLAQTFQIWSMVLGIKTVYFCGSFPTSSQLIRDEISKAFAARSLVNQFGKSTEHYFIRSGSYLGCLGAMFSTMKSDTKK